MQNQKVLILNFGGQYDQLIARRVRECSVYCEVKPYTMTLSEIRAFDPIGIIFTGGPDSVYKENSYHPAEGIFELGIPILGICYGCQLLAHHLGGMVTAAENENAREYGKTLTFYDNSCLLFDGLDEESISWMSHGDYMKKVPDGFRLVARSGKCPNVAICDENRKYYGVQFHPEVNHTENGTTMIRNFLYKVCGAVGSQLTCVFVDHGLLRKDEGDEVEKAFEKWNINLSRLNAGERFLKKLEGITEPEQKRKIIGEEFIRVFEEEAKKIGAVDFLVQGTIYPDVVESGLGGESAVIKSHHNVGGLPEYVDFKEIIEPLRDLFKDEVRKAGLELGIPEYLVYRQPFPGPGLGIRIIGEVNAEKVKIVQDADAIYREEIANAGLDRSIGQYFAGLTNMRSVGVMGDERTYDYAVALRAVNTVDFMTAEAAEIPYEVLNKVMNRIINEVRGVNRVMYDLTSKPPGTIEFE